MILNSFSNHADVTVTMNRASSDKCHAEGFISTGPANSVWFEYGLWSNFKAKRMALEDGRFPAGVTTLRSNILHLLHCALFFAIFATIESIALQVHQVHQELDPWTSYGTKNTILLYFLRYFTLLPLPLVLLQFSGLFFYNAFPSKVPRQVSPICAPFICIRTVTRGDFPYLVRDTIQRNLECCKEAGLKNFSFEVVTDKSVHLPPNERVYEIVVPSEYRTKSGALFKARALQYCLEDDVNKLADNNWIVHLDEETLLTVDSVQGILNFVTAGKHQFGQGLITYAGERVVNWITTLADCIRVGADMGNLRCQFKMFHKPLNGWKGSFMVNQVGPERSVSFDHGPDGSITEDCFFAFKACEAGYTFDFIDGHMTEKSPFTLKDFVKQRKRWLQGTILTTHSRNIPIRVKLLHSVVLYSLPFATLNFVMSTLFPIPCPLFVDMVSGFLGSVMVYLYVFGAIKCFTLSRYGKLQCLLCIIGAVCLIPFNVVVENLAAVFAVLETKHKFHVVNKVSEPTTKIV